MNFKEERSGFLTEGVIYIKDIETRFSSSFASLGSQMNTIYAIIDSGIECRFFYFGELPSCLRTGNSVSVTAQYNKNYGNYVIKTVTLSAEPFETEKLKQSDQFNSLTVSSEKIAPLVTTVSSADNQILQAMAILYPSELEQALALLFVASVNDILATKNANAAIYANRVIFLRGVYVGKLQAAFGESIDSTSISLISVNMPAINAGYAGMFQMLRSMVIAKKGFNAALLTREQGGLF